MTIPDPYGMHQVVGNRNRCMHRYRPGCTVSECGRERNEHKSQRMESWEMDEGLDETGNTRWCAANRQQCG